MKESAGKKQFLKEKKITLDFPLQIDGKEVSELTMRRAKASDMIAAHDFSENLLGQNIAVFAAMCGYVPDDFVGMDAVDLGKMQEAYQDFLLPIRPTAE